MFQRRLPQLPAIAVLAFAACWHEVGAAGGAEVRDAARVVAVWPAGPLEVRLALDRPAEQVMAGRWVGKAFRFDTQQRNIDDWRRRGSPHLVPPMGTLNVVSARLDEARRTLILSTDPHSREAVYLANPETPRSAPEGARIAYDLTGAAVTWSPAEAEAEANPAWEGWWPELDPAASERATRGSLEHERGFALLEKPGKLTLDTLLALPGGRVRVELTASAPVEATLGGENPSSQSQNRAEFVVESTGEPNPLFATITTGAGPRRPTIEVRYRKEGDATPTRIRRPGLLLPWAPLIPSNPPAPASPDFLLTGGDPARGAAVFFGEQAKCSTCHQVGGKGGAVGPDLSDRAGRPLLEVFRDIAEPSVTIHPDFVAYTVAMKDGRVLAGVIRAESGETLRVTDTEAKTTSIRRAEIEELRPSGTSIMPVGLVGVLGPEKLRDLLAFLTEPRAQNQNGPSPRTSP